MFNKGWSELHPLLNIFLDIFVLLTDTHAYCLTCQYIL